MSYVFFAAVWERGVYLVADKRMCKKENGRYIPVSDDVQKIGRINDKLIMGWVGAMQKTTPIFRLIKEISDMGVIYPDEMTSNIVRNSWDKQIFKDRMQMAILGMMQNGAPGVSIIDGYNKDNILTWTTSLDSPCWYYSLGTGTEVEHDEFERDIREILTNRQSETFEQDLFTRVDTHIVRVSEAHIVVGPTVDHLSITWNHGKGSL